MTCTCCVDKYDGFPPCSLYDDMYCPYDFETEHAASSIFDFDHE